MLDLLSLLAGQSLGPAVNTGLPTEGQGAPMPIRSDGSGTPITPTAPASDPSRPRGLLSFLSSGLASSLGHLGDTALRASGQNPVWSSMEDEAALKRAAPGFVDNPQEALRQIYGISPEIGLKFQAAQNNSSKIQNTIDNSVLKRNVDARKLIGGLLRSAKDPATLRLAMDQAKIIADRAGVSLDDLPTDLENPDAVYNWTYGTMPVKDQEADASRDATQDYRNRNLDERGRHNRATEGIGQQNANSNSTRTNTDREYKRAGVIRNAAETTIHAAGVGAKNTGQVADRNIRQQNTDLARQRVTNSVVAGVVKNNPGATIQRNSTTGKVRYSTDGGKTWNMAN